MAQASATAAAEHPRAAPIRASAGRRARKSRTPKFARFDAILQHAWRIRDLKSVTGIVGGKKGKAN